MKRIGTLTSLIRWFDCEAGVRGATPEQIAAEPLRVEWLRSMPFFAMHGVCLAAFWVGVSWIALAVALALFWIRMFAVTAFYHRYFSHRTFKTNRFWQFIFGLVGSAATQRGPLWWAAHHRHHHRHSDQPGDVHSPHEHGLLWSHMGWITSRKMFPTNYQAVPDLVKYPELVFLNRFDLLTPIALAVCVYALGVVLGRWVPELGTNGPQMLIWGFFISTVALFHSTCTINSLAHLMGRRRYATKDESRNSLLLALLTLGEGWHNNHHHYPAAVRQGFFWWEIDVTYYILKIMSWLGIIWDLNAVPKAHRARNRVDALIPQSKETPHRSTTERTEPSPTWGPDSLLVNAPSTTAS